MLKLVVTAPITPKAKALRRVRTMENQRGEWQCLKCGCRSLVSITNGVSLVNGRLKGATIVKNECLNCWREGIFSPMETTLKPVK